jgi:hypothetical protein
MKYFLGNIKYYPANFSFLKSIYKAMASYSNASFILFCSYANLGLFVEFLHINGRTLLYLYIFRLFPRISFTQIILILST